MALQKILDSDITENGVISAPDKLTGTASQNKAVFDKLISANQHSVKARFNKLIDDLEEDEGTQEKPTGASNIGAKLDGYEGTDVQALLEEIVDEVNTKADLDTDAVEGNVAQFDADGNPVDSGHALSEYVVKVDGKGLSTNDYDNTEKGKVADAYAKRHEHSNKSLLDSITDALVNGWSSAVTWVTTNGTNVLNHLSNTTVHVTSGDKSNWNGKSVVSVSNTGTSTDTVGYITINGVEKKMAGGGGGGTSDYNDLTNKPQINSVALSGNKSASDLGLVASVSGKGLSTNDYDNTEKGNVSANTSARHKHYKKTITIGTSWEIETGGFKNDISNQITFTANTKVDLQPSNSIISSLIELGIVAMYVENNGTNLYVHIVGDESPSESITIQATYVESEVAS